MCFPSNKLLFNVNMLDGVLCCLKCFTRECLVFRCCVKSKDLQMSHAVQLMTVSFTAVGQSEELRGGTTVTVFCLQVELSDELHCVKKLKIFSFHVPSKSVLTCVALQKMQDLCVMFKLNFKTCILTFLQLNITFAY